MATVSTFIIALAVVIAAPINGVRVRSRRDYGSNSGAFSGSASGSGFYPNFYQPPQPFDYQGIFQYLQNLQAQTQNQAAANYPQGFGVPNNDIDNNVAERFGGSASAGGFSGAGTGGFPSGFGMSSGFGMPSGFAFPMGGMGGSPNFAGASAAAGIGPQGGFQSANLFPDMGLGSRFGGSVAAPEGGTYGVFTSSSSGSSDINGKKTSFKQATVGVNDNGKISFHTIKDPQ